MELTCMSAEEVYLDGKLLDIKKSLQKHNHSPSGFSWGYGGSGPSQLALAILIEMLEGTPQEHKISEYQVFKWDVIAKLPQVPCVLELDFWGWFRGQKEYRFEVRPL